MTSRFRVFSGLAGRHSGHNELFNLADEIERQDRQYFDDAIIEAFNLKVPREAVYESLRELVSIRLSVKN